MSAAAESRTLNAGFWCAAILLAGAAAIAFHLAPQATYGVPYDEYVKVRAVREGTQTFQHPILMLQIVRLMNFFAGERDPIAVVQLGRLAAALSGGLLVFAAIALARRSLDTVASLGAGVLTAVSPLTVLHAQLFKEDIFVAPWLVLGLLALDRLRAEPTRERAVLLGLASGLAASTKYIGVILLPLSLLVPFLADTSSRRAFYRMMIPTTLIAFLIFCALNFPLFLTPDVFISGLGFELKHVVSGHSIVHHGWYSYFLFSWNANLWPGLLAPIAWGGLAGALWIVLHWRDTHPALRLLLTFGVIWYLLHELSPMKPHPEGARHMTVLSAVFAILTAYALERLTAAISADWRAPAITAGILLLAAPPAWASYRLTRSAPNDTAVVAERISAAMNEPLSIGPRSRYRGTRARLLKGSVSEILTQGQYLLVNEVFAVDYARSADFGRQRTRIRHLSGIYSALLQRPALRITSTAGAFAYRNTPFRIIALQGDLARLAEAAQRMEPVADISFELVPERTPRRYPPDANSAP